MLLEFRVSNFRSIGPEVVLSMLPDPDVSAHSANIITRGKYHALNAVAIYGANASGKTNLLSALGVMRQMVTNATKNNSTDTLPYLPNRLLLGYEAKPTLFEVTAAIAETQYRYGFSYNKTEIVGEWLFRLDAEADTETTLFVRKEQTTLEPNRAFSELEDVLSTTNHNTLLLAKLDANKNETATRVFQFINNLNPIDGDRTDTLELFTYSVLKENVEPLSTGVRSLLTDFNLSFDDIKPSEKALPPDVAKHLSRPGQAYPGTIFAQTQHAVYTEQGEPTGDTVWLDMDEDESLGTQKVYHLAGPVVDTLANGKVLLIDEVGASMHTELTLKLIGLFLDPEINTKGAQLIFCTHDTNLLQYSPLRPDQIYFTEKAHNRATQLYSLADFEHDSGQIGLGKPDYEKPYLEGLYGGIPFLGDFSKLASLSRQPK